MDRPDRRSCDRQTNPLRWFAGLPCLVAALVVAVMFVVTWTDLPDPMSVHFDEGGEANRFASPVEILLISELTLLGLGVGLSRSAVRGSLGLRTLYVTSATAAVSLGYLFTVAVLVNAKAGTAAEVQMPLWHLAVAAGLASAAAGGVLMPLKRPPHQCKAPDH